MVLLIIATVVGALTPSVIRQITHARINRATRVIAADFYLAQSTASRTRKPVSMSVDSAARTVTMTDTQSATQISTRQYGTTSEFKLQQVYSVPASIIVFPSGMLSASVAVTVGDPSYRRYVNVSRAGQIRIQ
jgi:hypothetical protein